MKQVKKFVYYCDHCNKKTLSKSATLTHEGRCTNNPNRFCRTCGREDIKPIIDKFKASFTLTERFYDYPEAETFDSHTVNWVDGVVTMQDVRNKCEDCPNCILSVLRQTGMNRHYFHFEFDYKKELSDWLFERSKNS